MDNVEITPAIVRFSAMNYLALREHSALELERKLLQKFDQPELFNPGNQEASQDNRKKCIANVIAKLIADGLQSDERFTDAFISMRQRQGKGPLVIRLELKEKGISGNLIANYLNESDDVWNQIARRAYLKKSSHLIINDRKQLSKYMRFLAMRGFSTAHIQYALNVTE